MNRTLATIQLSKTTKFIVDNRGKTAPTAETGIALIATNCVNNNHLYPAYEKLRFVSQETYNTWFRAHPKPGDILLTNKGSQNGAICLVPDPVDFVIAQDMVALRTDEAVIDPLFLFAALRSPDVQRQIRNLDVSGVIPHFKKTDFDKLYLPYPDRGVQVEIGRFYFETSQMIDLNDRINRNLESIAMAIFKDWLVDFGPTRAKAEGRAPYLGSELWGLFPSVLNEEGRPAGWEVGEVSRIACQPKDSIVPQAFPEETFDHFSIPAYDSDRMPSPELGRLILSNKTVVRPNSVLLSKLNPEIPRVWLTGANGPRRGICSTEFLVFSPKIQTEMALIYLIFSENSFRERLRSMVTGTSKSHQRVSARNVLGIQVTLPPASIREACAEIMGPLFSRLLKNRQQNLTLTQLRDLLLPKLISGEICLKNAEKAVCEVA